MVSESLLRLLRSPTIFGDEPRSCELRAAGSGGGGADRDALPTFLQKVVNILDMCLIGEKGLDGYLECIVK